MLLTSPLGYENVYILNDLTKIFRSFVPSHLESLGTLSGLATDLKLLVLGLHMLSDLTFGASSGFLRVAQAMLSRLALQGQSPHHPLSLC